MAIERCSLDIGFRAFDRTVMKRRYSNFKRFTLFLLFSSITEVYLRTSENNEDDNVDYHKGCAYLHCEDGERCVHRKFRCKNTPCPSMLYCAKTRTESLRGPPTCDTVRCSRGFVCVVKVRHCHWDEGCKQQIARCISQKDYHEGPASCAGFKCPSGNHCILRESFCLNPPCKLLKSCTKNKDAQIWLGRCRNLGCPSEFECFLRRPDKTCAQPPCKHTPDCLTTTENEISNIHCRGWVCPRTQRCFAQITGACQPDRCDITRFCNDTQIIPENHSSNFLNGSLSNADPRSNAKVNDQRSAKRALAEIENELIPREQEKRKVEITTGTVKPDTPEVLWDGNKENVREEKPRDTIRSDSEERKSLHSWLHHLNSKTELDAIELWIKNAVKQRDFGQFQQWLRSVKNILGPDGYEQWQDRIHGSTSRSEEFREWLRASNTAELFALAGDKPDNKPEEPIFPETQSGVTGIPNQDRYPINEKSNTQSEGSGGPRKDEKLATSEKDLMETIEKLIGPHTILLPPYSALETALLRYLSEPNYSDLNNPSRLSKVENINGQPHYLVPLRDVEKLSPGNSQLRFPPVEKTKDLHQENPSDERKNRYDNPHTFSRDNHPGRDYEWNLYSQIHRNSKKNSKETTEIFSPSDDENEFDELFARTIASTFINASDNGRVLKPNDTNHLRLTLKEDTDENSGIRELESFMETNGETILPYIKTLLDAMSQDYDFPNGTEPRSDESTIKRSFTDHDEFEDFVEASDESESCTEETKSVSAKMKSRNEANFHSSNCEDIHETQAEIISRNMHLIQQEKVSRTPRLIYGPDGPMLQFFHTAPSYEASGDTDIYDEQNSEDVTESSENRGKDRRNDSLAQT